MRLYISTPINARREKTFREKYEAAERRCGLLKGKMLADTRFRQYGEIVTTFDFNPLGMFTEEEAMGRCVAAVMQCDAVFLDHGWERSRGCILEYCSARIYGKTVIKHDDY